MLFSDGIAALSITFFWPSKESNQRKLPAALASIKASAVFSVVLTEPDGAGFFD
jgi:hypothetical protein